VLSAGVLVIGFTYVVVTLVADVLSALLNPRIRFGASE
jgi:ABC-type dipeptide/oligopeptide/nickel transport system permease component